MNSFALILLGAAPAAAAPAVVASTSPGLAPGATVTTLNQDESQPGIRWIADIDEARRVAAKENKHVLLSFTGTGWCSWCKKLEADVLETPLFSETTASRFVLVRADFDREGNARDDLPCAAKNDALKSSLGVSGFPRVVLMTADGVGYAQMGYERGGAGPYTDKLVAQHQRARDLELAIPKATAAVASAKSKEEALAAASAAVQLLRDAGPHALGRPLVPIAQATLAAIPNQGATAEETEREKAAMLALAGANVVDDAFIDRAFRVDPKNEAGLPEAALAAAMRTIPDPSAVDPLIERTEAMLSTLMVHDPQVAAQLYGDCAYWIKNWQQDADRARMMASFALKLDPVDENLRGMLQTLAGK